MQLLAHSMVPTTQVTYVHLGYLSAGSVVPYMRAREEAANIVAITMLIVGVLVLLLARKRPIRITIGIVLIFCGIGGIAQYQYDKQHPTALNSPAVRLLSPAPPAQRTTSNHSHAIGANQK